IFFKIYYACILFFIHFSITFYIFCRDFARNPFFFHIKKLILAKDKTNLYILINMKKNIFLAVLVCTSTFFSCKKNQTESIDPISRRVVNVAELENKYMFLSENPTTENLDEFKKYIENQMTLSKQMFDLEDRKSTRLNSSHVKI